MNNLSGPLPTTRTLRRLGRTASETGSIHTTFYEKQTIMKNIAMKTAAAVVTGLFALGVMTPTATLAQDKAKPEMKMAKKAAKSDPAVMALQEALNKSGAKLKVDGMMGGKTKAALRKYQKANGLKASGMVDNPTKMKLGL